MYCSEEQWWIQSAVLYHVSPVIPCSEPVYNLTYICTSANEWHAANGKQDIIAFVGSMSLSALCCHKIVKNQGQLYLCHLNVITAEHSKMYIFDKECLKFYFSFQYQGGLLLHNYKIKHGFIVTNQHTVMPTNQWCVKLICYRNFHSVGDLIMMSLHLVTSPSPSTGCY